MKRLILGTIFLVVNLTATQATANDEKPKDEPHTLYLTCSGNFYFYEKHWGKPSVGDENGVVVKLNRDTGMMDIASVFINVGRIEQPYREKPDVYFMIAEYDNLTILGQKIKSLTFAVNRITGDASANYKLESGKKYVAFLGKCEPGHVQF